MQRGASSYLCPLGRGLGAGSGGWWGWLLVGKKGKGGGGGEGGGWGEDRQNNGQVNLQGFVKTTLWQATLFLVAPRNKHLVRKKRCCQDFSEIGIEGVKMH